MMLPKIGIYQALRIAGVLLLLGLFTEAASLHWIHPIAFMLFAILGGTFLAAGVLLYLYSLVSLSTAQDPDAQNHR